MPNRNTCFAPGCDNLTETEYCRDCTMNGGVKIEKKMYSEIIEENLTYGQAMIKCLDEGYRVTRAIWGGYWERDWDEIFGDIIIAVLKNNAGKAPATPYQSDMLATDWMVVK